MTKARIREIRNAQRRTHNGEATAMIDELLAEIERLQRFTRRGITPGAEPEDLPNSAKGKKPKGTPDPRIAEFKEGWETAYLAFHKEKYPHGGVKDVMATKRLLLLGSVSDLLDTAWDAWHHPEKWACARAITIAGFASQYAAVRLDIKMVKNGGRPVMTGPAGCNL